MKNNSKGNMYPNTITRNFIGGECPHNCSYCYVCALKRFPVMKKRYSGKLRLIESEFKKPLGSGKNIFIGSCNDMFADEVPDEWIKRVLEYCSKSDNNYLFQTKNPERFKYYTFPEKTILGATIETNREDDISNAPNTTIRKHWLSQLDCDKMVSIEPIMDFDLGIMRRWMIEIEPKFVSIGADSKGHNLPEPSWDKVQSLIKELKTFTKVKVKDNLMRLKKCHNNQTLD